MLLFWGLILGLPAGFILTLWFGRRSFPFTLFGARCAQFPNHYSFDLDFMCKELQQITGELAHKVNVIEEELQNIRVKMLEIENGFSALVSTGKYPAGFVSPKKATLSTHKGSLPTTGQPLKVLQCRQEIYRLYREGLSRQEIARQLKIRQGEVELVLSLKGYGG